MKPRAAPRARKRPGRRGRLDDIANVVTTGAVGVVVARDGHCGSS
jgi:hypothetical protein